MAALVVNVSPSGDASGAGGRIGIFPGGTTTAMYAADTPFWIGYGFAADDEDAGLDDGTRFELDIDGVTAHVITRVDVEHGVVIRKTSVARLEGGLPAGWHELVGRWFDGGRLVVSSRVSVQFVDR